MPYRNRNAGGILSLSVEPPVGSSPGGRATKVPCTRKRKPLRDLLKNQEFSYLFCEISTPKGGAASQGKIPSLKQWYTNPLKQERLRRGGFSLFKGGGKETHKQMQKEWIQVLVSQHRKHTQTLPQLKNGMLAWSESMTRQCRIHQMKKTNSNFHEE